MSAAATAAGYLYASGRLRSRATREENGNEPAVEKTPEKPAKQAVRVAVLQTQERERAEKPKRVPKIEYRTRRWKPNE